MNLPIFERACEVENSLHHHSLDLALEWCWDHASKLRRLNNNLEFLLRTQEFVCLLLRGEQQQGLCFAKEHLAPNAELAPSLVQQLMGLLAFSSPHKAPPE